MVVLLGPLKEMIASWTYHDESSQSRIFCSFFFFFFALCSRYLIVISCSDVTRQDQKTFTQETNQKVIQCKGTENMMEHVRRSGCTWLTHWLRKQNSNNRRSEQSFGKKLY